MIKAGPQSFLGQTASSPSPVGQLKHLKLGQYFSRLLNEKKTLDVCNGKHSTNGTDEYLYGGENA